MLANLKQTNSPTNGHRAAGLLVPDLALLCFRIVFYRRVSPRTNLDMFTYIVCVECWNVNNSNLIHMLDFVQGGRRAKGV